MKSITGSQIKKIKTLQRRLGLENGDYRLMLRNVAGVSSCKELKGAKIDLVIRHLEGRIGYRRSQVQFGKERTERNNEGKPNWATERQVRKIREMWRQVSREKTEAALRVWLRRRFKVGAVEWLTVGQAAGVIEGLKAMGKCID